MRRVYSPTSTIFAILLAAGENKIAFIVPILFLLPYLVIVIIISILMFDFLAATTDAMVRFIFYLLFFSFHDFVNCCGLSVSLPVSSLSISLRFCMPVCFFACMCLCDCVFVFLRLGMYISMYVCVCFCVSVYVCVFMCVYNYMCLYAYICFCAYASLCVYVSVRLCFLQLTV